jgi:hypothetical protein
MRTILLVATVVGLLACSKGGAPIQRGDDARSTVDAPADDALAVLGGPIPDGPAADAAKEPSPTDAGDDDAPATDDAGPPACAPKAPTCAPTLMSGDECDPTCDTCACGTWCHYLTYASCWKKEGTVPPGGDCEVADCAPGGVCIYQRCNKSYVCAQFCRADADCVGGARCSTWLSDTEHKLCSPLGTSCDPTSTTGGGCAPGLGCYVIGLSGDTVGCDCGDPTSTDGYACLSTAECAPGYLCAPSSLGLTVCRRVCELGAPVCPTGQTCFRFTGSSKWGYCAKDQL